MGESMKNLFFISLVVCCLLVGCSTVRVHKEGEVFDASYTSLFKETELNNVVLSKEGSDWSASLGKSSALTDLDQKQLTSMLIKLITTMGL